MSLSLIEQSVNCLKVSGEAQVMLFWFKQHKAHWIVPMTHGVTTANRHLHSNSYLFRVHIKLLPPYGNLFCIISEREIQDISYYCGVISTLEWRRKIQWSNNLLGGNVFCPSICPMPEDFTHHSLIMQYNKSWYHTVLSNELKNH
jgi:hypothetical protein